MKTKNIISSKINILASILLLSCTSCFKDAPSKEFAQVAGSWKVDEVLIEYYDSLGTQVDQKSFPERGYIMLTHNDGSLADNSFSYSFKADNEVFNSESAIAYAIGLSNRWDVSVTANHINFGNIDLNTNFSTQLIALTIDNLRTNRMDWLKIDRNFNGSIARKETFRLKRSNGED